MRRALLTNEFAPTPGGVERLLYERARSFQPSGLTVFTAYTPDCERFDTVQAYKSCRSGRYVGGIPGLREAVRSLLPMQACYRQHRQQHFDVLECGQTFPACLFAWLLHRKYRTPYLVCVHGPPPPPPTWSGSTATTCSDPAATRYCGALFKNRYCRHTAS